MEHFDWCTIGYIFLGAGCLGYLHQVRPNLYFGNKILRIYISDFLKDIPCALLAMLYLKQFGDHNWLGVASGASVKVVFSFASIIASCSEKLMLNYEKKMWKFLQDVLFQIRFIVMAVVLSLAVFFYDVVFQIFNLYPFWVTVTSVFSAGNVFLLITKIWIRYKSRYSIEDRTCNQSLHGLVNWVAWNVNLLGVMLVIGYIVLNDTSKNQWGVISGCGFGFLALFIYSCYYRATKQNFNFEPRNSI